MYKTILNLSSFGSIINQQGENMSFNTPQGKAYTLADLERLASIDTFGQFNGAVAGLIQRAKFLEGQNRELVLHVESFKSQLLALRAEVNSLKK